MITEQDLREAIAECHGERNPNSNTCIKLAAYYTILNQITGQAPDGRSYESRSSGSAKPEAVMIDSGSEFSQIVNGRKPSEIWPLIDELMETLMVVNPRLYAGVIRRLKDRA